MKQLSIAILMACALLACRKDNHPEPAPPVIPPQSPPFIISNSASLDSANRTNFAPGSVIVIEGSVNGTLTITESGLPGNPILITGDTLSSGDSSAIRLYNAGNITVHDIVLIGSGKNYALTRHNAGVDLITDDHKRYANILIQNVTASRFCDAGIRSSIPWPDHIADYNQQLQWIKDYPGGYDNLTVRDCNVFENGFAGISLHGVWPGIQHHNVKVINSKAWSQQGLRGSATTSYRHSGNGIYVSGARKVLIDSCKAWNNGYLYGTGLIGIWGNDVDSMIIQNCTSIGNITTNRTDGGGIDIDGGATNCIVRYNFTANNMGAGILVYEYGSPFRTIKNVEVHNNVSLNDGLIGGNYNGYGGISIGGVVEIQDVNIHHNTIINTVPGTSALTKNGANVRGLTIRNNILFGPNAPYLWGDYADNWLKDPVLDYSNFKPLPHSPIFGKAIGAF